MKLERDYDPDGHDGQRNSGCKILRKGPSSSRNERFDFHAEHGLKVRCKLWNTARGVRHTATKDAGRKIIVTYDSCFFAGPVVTLSMGDRFTDV